LDVRVQNTVSAESHIVRTYGAGAVNSDPYYRENMVLADLAAGLYRVTFTWHNIDRQEWVQIHPGQVTYFTFRDEQGFKVGAPSPPTPDSLPTSPVP